LIYNKYIPSSNRISTLTKDDKIIYKDISNIRKSIIDITLKLNSIVRKSMQQRVRLYRRQPQSPAPSVRIVERRENNRRLCQTRCVELDLVPMRQLVVATIPAIYVLNEFGVFVGKKMQIF